MNNYLKAIVDQKKRYIETLHHAIISDPSCDMATMFNSSKKRLSGKSFRQAIAKKKAVIAEIKRKSPSKNQLAAIESPEKLAQQYCQGGAAAISVLTDTFGFGGSADDLKQVSTKLGDTLPLLRKDFILDPIQLAESILYGADAVLLIVNLLKTKTAELLNQAKLLNLDVIVEVHDQEELEFAISIQAEMIGVNNRNLTTFEVNTDTAKKLIKFIPEDVISIAESGILSASLAKDYFNSGYHGVLIGEALVKTPTPEKFINEIIAV